jgi:hypothetical protein
MIKLSEIKCAGHVVACMGEKTNACRISEGNPEGRRPLGRTGRRWLDSFKNES